MSMIVAHVVINEGNEPNSMILTQAIANNSRGVRFARGETITPLCKHVHM
jgi:hypothetical protein